MKNLKKCCKCSERKPKDEFHDLSKSTDGKAYSCKICINKYRLEWNRDKMKDPEYKKEHRRKSRKNTRPKYSELSDAEKKESYARTKVYHAKYPEKYKARTRCKRIYPKIKGNTNHHWSYLPQNDKDIIEIPKELHYKLHKYLVYRQEFMCYESHNGTLLNTKDMHLRYIEWVESEPVYRL